VMHPNSTIGMVNRHVKIIDIPSIQSL